ncbi:Aspartate transaminase [Trichoderma simmonsii]|uniref:Aspartate transaminase n=1 Tax=Trichoderma simmonsii TaxID=1491479 RepID=A0A8G0LTA2_9HYPO|nr:Aspartate transaminase [Trichoderma simmonsii]
MLDDIEAGPPDPMYTLKKWADGDTCDQKADLGAKVELSKQSLGHDYEVTTGNPEFLHHAARLILGQDCSRLASSHVASVQTISGTGANHLAVLLLAKCIVPQPKVFIGTPSWGNYKPMLDLVGLSTVEYPHYNEIDRTLDFPSILAAITSAPRNSVFIFQSCCNNPTGADPSQEQWHELAMALRAGDHIPLFDSAYQGLGRGLEEDSFAVRLFAKLGFSMITPGHWGHILEECGLFSFLKLSPRQCSVLIQEFHIYLPPNGRINISGLNKSNVERVARAIDYVVRLPDA